MEIENDAICSFYSSETQFIGSSADVELMKNKLWDNDYERL